MCLLGLATPANLVASVFAWTKLGHAVAIPPICAIVKVNSRYGPKSTARALVSCRLKKNGLKLARQHSPAIAILAVDLVVSEDVILSANITTLAVGEYVAAVIKNEVCRLFTTVVSNNNGRV